MKLLLKIAAGVVLLYILMAYAVPYGLYRLGFLSKPLNSVKFNRNYTSVYVYKVQPEDAHRTLMLVSKHDSVTNFSYRIVDQNQRIIQAHTYNYPRKAKSVICINLLPEIKEAKIIFTPLPNMTPFAEYYQLYFSNECRGF